MPCRNAAGVVCIRDHSKIVPSLKRAQVAVMIAQVDVGRQSR